MRYFCKILEPVQDYETADDIDDPQIDYRLRAAKCYVKLKNYLEALKQVQI